MPIRRPKAAPLSETKQPEQKISTSELTSRQKKKLKDTSFQPTVLKSGTVFDEPGLEWETMDLFERTEGKGDYALQLPTSISHYVIYVDGAGRLHMKYCATPTRATEFVEALKNGYIGN